MELSEDQIEGLSTALCEATLLGVEVDPKGRRASVLFSVLTLPETGPMPADTTARLLLNPVGRVVASLRHGHWDDTGARVEKIGIEDLSKAVQDFGGLAVYGEDFIDAPEDRFTSWSSRASVEFRSGDDGQAHTLDLFQAGPKKHLDIRIWFDDLSIVGPNKSPISIDEFIAGGRRWWQAFYKKDPRTQGQGMIPLDES